MTQGLQTDESECKSEKWKAGENTGLAGLGPHGKLRLKNNGGVPCKEGTWRALGQRKSHCQPARATATVELENFKR